jgi:hypothetical protein
MCRSIGSAPFLIANTASTTSCKKQKSKQVDILDVDINCLSLRK